GSSPRSHLADKSPKRCRGCRLHRELFKRCRIEKHFIGIANDAVPAEVADTVHNLRGTGTSAREIAAMKDEVGGGLRQVRQNRFERGEIVVDVGYYRDAQLLVPRQDQCLWP